MRIFIPYTEADLLSWLHDNAKVVYEDYQEVFILLDVIVDEIGYARIKDYVMPMR